MIRKSLRERIQGIQLAYPTFLVSDFQNANLFKNMTAANDLSGFINGIFKIAIIVGAMLAVLRLVYAGFLYMGTDIFDKKGAAKEAIQNALIGLLLLVTTYILLNQINPDILNLNITQNLKAPSAANDPAAPAAANTSSTAADTTAPNITTNPVTGESMYCFPDGTCQKI